MVKGAQHAAREQDFGITLYHSDYDPRQEIRILQELATGAPRALLICSEGSEESQQELKRLVSYGLPAVLVDYRPPEIPADSVSNDNYQIGLDATNYLLGLGHKRIAYVGDAVKRANEPERMRGYRDAITVAGMEPVCHSITHEAGEIERLERSVEAEVLPWLRSFPEGQRPTAIFSVNDTLAVGICRAVRTLGLTIPDDIAVIGVANVDFGPIMPVPLSTIDQRPYEMGYEAAKLAIQRILGKGPDGPVAQVQEHVLIERETTRKGAGPGT
jgi:LacI family transcriptional regulator